MSYIYKTFICILLVFMIGQAQPLETISRLTDVRDMVGVGDTIWAATSGGLVLYDIQLGRTVEVFRESSIFRDISLNCAAREEDGTVWVGSTNGYLYERTPEGVTHSYADFWASGAEINRLYVYDSLLLVAHSMGISLFDIESRRVLFSTGDVDEMGSVSGEDILVSGDSLFFTWSTSEGDAGVALFDSVSQKLNSVAFTLPQQWENGLSAVTPVDNGYHSLLEEIDGTIYTFPGAAIKHNTLYYYGKGDSVKVVDATLQDSASGSVDIISGNLTAIFGDVQAFTLTQGRLFVGMATGGIVEINLSGDQVNFFRQELGGVNDHRGRYIHHDSRGEVWVIPYAEYSLVDTGAGPDSLLDVYPFWNSITRINTYGIASYNSQTPGFGSLGDNANFSGFAEGASGKLYFGGNGSALKVFDGVEWGRWLFDPIGQTVPWLTTDGSLGWTKVDGVLSDTRGNLWMTCYHTFGIHDNVPALLVMTEDGKKYRYLFPISMDKHPSYDLTMDSRGNIFVLFGTTPAPDVIISNDYYIIRGDLDPLDTVNVTENALLGDSGSFASRNSIYSASATTLGSIYVGTDGGVDIFRYGTQGVFATPIDYPEEYQKSVVSIAVQQSRELMQLQQDIRRYETLLWASVRDVGPVQMRFIEEVDANSDDLKALYYDPTFTPKVLTTEDGLPVRNEIPQYSLSLDKQNRKLWIADGLGAIMSYGIQFQASDVESNEGVRAYPNPYSHEHHNRVIIDRVTPSGFVDIYTSNGTLVFHADQNSGDLIEEGELEWVYQWRVPKGIAPGVYFVVAKMAESTTSIDRDNSFVRKLIITP